MEKYLPYIVIALVILIVGILIALIVIVLKKGNNNLEDRVFEYLVQNNEQSYKCNQEITSALYSFKEEIKSNMNEINEKIDDNLKEGFKNNFETIEKVNVSLGKLAIAQKNLDDLSNEVSSLNMVLSNSQLRGRFGEIALESILDNVFGDTNGLYETQYVFENGLRPDAVVFYKDKVLCIDSKFSYNNYVDLFQYRENPDVYNELAKKFRSALKMEITKVSDAYIKPSKTLPYAIMFIPSDGIYSYIQSDEDCYNQVVEYARSKNVVLCCPATLQAVLANFKTLHINSEIGKNLALIIKRINDLKDDNIELLEKWNSLNKSLDALTNKKNEFDHVIKGFNVSTEAILKAAGKEKLIEEKEKWFSLYFVKSARSTGRLALMQICCFVRGWGSIIS